MHFSQPSSLQDITYETTMAQIQKCPDDTLLSNLSCN